MLRRVRPFHHLVEPRPQRRAFVPQHVGAALETVLFMHRVERVGPRKCLGGFKSGKRCFKPDASCDEHIFGYAVALRAVLGEQVCLYVRHFPIIFLCHFDGNSRVHDCG